MNQLQNIFGLTFFLALIWIFAGHSKPNANRPPTATPPDSVFAVPSELTATVTNGNVTLHWTNRASTDGGVWVEYTTSDYDYVKLDALPSDSGLTSFEHLNVAPSTRFIYRLAPFFGRPTVPVKIKTGIAPVKSVPDLPSGPIDPANANPSGKECSLRTLATFASAMPSDVTTTLSSATSVELRWKDHASDEDGFLLEASARGDGDFVPCALLPPNTTSFRKAGLPAETECYFRVRAFFYGKPSDPVSVMVP